MPDLFGETTEQRVDRELSAMATLASGDTIEEVSRNIHERRDRQFRKGMDPQRSASPPKDRGAPPSHSTRTRSLWTAWGYILAPTETRDAFSAGSISGVGAKHDLFGFADFIAVPFDRALTPAWASRTDAFLIQSCTVTGLDAHVRDKFCGRELDKKAHAVRSDCLKAWLSPGRRAIALVWDRKDMVDGWLQSHPGKALSSYLDYRQNANTVWCWFIVEVTLSTIDLIASRRRT